MSIRVDSVNRIVGSIGISIQCLWVCWILNYIIRGNKPSQLRIIIPRTEVDEPGFVVGLFAGEVVPGDFFG